MDEDMLSLARDTLDTFTEAVIWAPGTNAVRLGPSRALNASDRLARRLEARPTANPAYSCQHETAAALILLAATDPDRFSRLTAGVFGTGIPPFATVEGLERLDGFLSVVGDDHDFCVVEEDGEPRIVVQSTLTRHVSTATPRSLLAAVARLLDAPAAFAP